MVLQIVGVVMVLAGIAVVAALVMAIIRLFMNAIVRVEGQLNFDRSYSVAMAVLCVIAVVFVLVTIIGLLGSMSKLV